MVKARRARFGSMLAGVASVLACAAGCGDHSPETAARPPETADSVATRSPNRIVQLLTRNEPVLGVSSGEHTPAQGTAMAANRETDFIFYSLEEPPYDIPALAAYRTAMVDAVGATQVRPLALRIPPIREGHQAAEKHVREALGAGVDGVVFPHVGSRKEAELAVRSLGSDLWPENPDGRLVAMLIIEDEKGVAHAREIAGTPGVSVIFAGPSDLRRAYNGDRKAAEDGVQTVLAACKEFGVPCGIQAGVKSIAGRLKQGFRVIIVSGPEALTLGREASGRND